MCGRYVVTTPGEVLAELFELDEKPHLVPRYNVAPTQEVAIVRPTEGPGRELTLARWGLIPHWAKERAIGDRLINARGETLAEKPSFRDSFRKRRCLIAADGFYEWQKVEGGKQPWLFRLRDGGPFGFAGLWSSWVDKSTGEIVESCAIVTTAPNELCARVHDRMPVIVPRAHHARWLDPEVHDPARLEPLLVAFPAAEMTAVAVSRRVNNPRNDDPLCLEPAA